MSLLTTNGLSYLLRRPLVPVVNGKSPLLILLHGVGSNEEDLFGMTPQLDPRFTIVSVRAPMVLGPEAFGWYHIQYGANGISYDHNEVERSRTMLEAFIPDVAAQYGADANSTFCMGFSQGAVMTYTLLRTAPALFKGAVIMSGRPTPDSEIQSAPAEALDGKSVIVTHGVWDEVLPITCGRETRDILSKLPLELAYHEYQMAHGVNSDCFRDVQLWLSAQCDNL